MKNLILTIILFASFSNLIAQDYIPMLGESNEWYVFETFEGTHTFHYITYGDEILNDKEYKKFGKYYDGFDPEGFIREDTILKKIFFIPMYPFEPSEVLLYDFSLEIGDSIFLEAYDRGYEQEGEYVLDSIKTINTLDGERRAFYLRKNVPVPNNWNDFPIWIEGIGAIGHILYRTIQSGSSEVLIGMQLSCVFKDSVKIYQSEISQELGICDYFRSDIQDFNSNEKVKVFPNPAQDYIEIECSYYLDYSVYSYDIYGSLIMKYENPEKIDISFYKEGNYIFQFHFKDFIETKKIMIIR